MPVVPFDSLPDSARVWIFAGDRPIVGAPATQLLAHVDDYLGQWKAHGHPLSCARDWRHDRFLASGCSIDGLFRTLQSLQQTLGTTLIGGGRVHYRDATGAIHSATREQFAKLGETGAVDDRTTVFDATVSTVGAWRERFETQLARAWHKDLVAKR